MNDIQLSAFTIIDKTMVKESGTVLGKNIRLFGEKLLDFLAQIFFNYSHFGCQEPPVHLAGYFS
jgi:hypothetical protein